jgi:hypothetical protein
MARRSPVSPAACAVALLLAVAGCSVDSDERPLLPWLKLRTTRSSFGQLGSSVTRSYEVRYYGFWRHVDADSAVVLSRDAAVLFRRGDASLIARGEIEARPLCRAASVVGIAPYAESVDCIDVLERRGPFGAARIAWKRLSSHGAVTAQAELAVDDIRHVVLGDVIFYDEAAHPFFLTVLERATTAAYEANADCALVGWRDGAPVVVARLPSARGSVACRDPQAWTGPMGQRLYASRALPATRLQQ